MTQKSSTRLVLICGLPASGKSTLARQLALKFPRSGWTRTSGRLNWVSTCGTTSFESVSNRSGTPRSRSERILSGADETGGNDSELELWGESLHYLPVRASGGAHRASSARNAGWSASPMPLERWDQRSFNLPEDSGFRRARSPRRRYRSRTPAARSPGTSSGWWRICHDVQQTAWWATYARTTRGSMPVASTTSQTG